MLATLAVCASAIWLITGVTSEPDGAVLGSLYVDDSEALVAEGYLPDGTVSPFDENHPAIAMLQPSLRRAVQQAARDAHGVGVDVRISSGWRSARYQRALLRMAIESYGSVEVALQYVRPPRSSKHVSGSAVDVVETDAQRWLSQHGSIYGLCQRYANEMWHFERLVAARNTCPAPIPDASSNRPPNG